MRLAIISTHPIQYNAPLFALLSEAPGMELKVFYTWSQRQSNLRDEKFGKEVRWDIPLLQGYDSMYVENSAKRPGNDHFNGIICPELIDAISSFNPTHLLVYGWNFRAHFRAMRWFKGRIPVLFRGDSTLLDESGGLKQMIRRLALRFVYRYVDKALYVGEANRQYYLAHGLKPYQLVYAPHAIDNGRFEGWSDEQEKLLQQYRKELQIREEDRVILFVGKFEPKKDPLLLLEAFTQLRKEWRSPGKIKLLFVGDGALEERLRRGGAGLPEVLFLPFQNQSRMPVIYRLGEVLCLPSRGPGETWGLVINEANACGTKCVISSKAGCAADLGDVAGNRIFVSGNADDLARQLRLSLEDPYFDREVFLERWNYGRMVEALKEIAESDEQ